MGLRIGERFNHTKELLERTGPAMQQEQRDRILMARFLMYEMNPEIFENGGKVAPIFYPGFCLLPREVVDRTRSIDGLAHDYGGPLRPNGQLKFSHRKRAAGLPHQICMRVSLTPFFMQ
jgi:hypothetical protein